MHAGDALVALGDAEGAAEHFGAALRMADESEDFEAVAEVSRRLRNATRRSASEHSGREGQREQPKRKLSKAQRQRQDAPSPGSPGGGTLTLLVARWATRLSVDRSLLPHPSVTPRDFNVKDYADFAEHERLELIR